MTNPQEQHPRRSPSPSPWTYIPCLGAQDAPESTDRFRARALDACLATYLEYAIQRLKKGNPLDQQETLHLVHHVKASGHFRTPRQIVWQTRSVEEQCKHPRRCSTHLTGVVDYSPEMEANSSWLVCYEHVVHNIRFFDFFVSQTNDGQGERIEGPQFDGPSESEVYIVVGERPAKIRLVSIGKWTYAGELGVGLKEVLGRVVDLVRRQPREQEALLLIDAERISEDKGELEDSSMGLRDPDESWGMGAV